jgi:LuxR family maltose regulon positive regulatory protein
MLTLARDLPNGDSYLAQAQELLITLFDLAESNGWGSKTIEILVLQSLAFDLAGERKSALEKLERALTLAETEGFVRTFVDEGPPMARLLYEVLSYRNSPDYVHHLLAAFPEVGPEPPKLSQAQPDADWIEPLSKRELEVLHLIAEGLPNKEIATKLYLSLNTVKAHTRTIYSKLDVNSRIQAAARARALGLLSGSD